MVHDLCTAAAQVLGTTPLRHAGTDAAPNAMFALSSMAQSWLNLPAGAPSSEGDVAARLGGVPTRIRALARALWAASEGRFAGVGPAALAAAWWRQLAEVGPVVVALDDLRAAPELARALRLLCGRRTPHPLIVVAGDGAQLPAPAALIPLPPLPSAVVRRLLHRVMRVPDTVAHEIVRESGGQPGVAVRRLRAWARGETGLAAVTPVPETSLDDPSRRLDAVRDALADQVPERALALLDNATTPAAIALRAEAWHALGEPARAETDAATALAAPDLPRASRLALERLRVLLALSVGDRALAEARLKGLSATDDPIEAVRTDILAGRLSTILGQYEDAVCRLTRAASAAEKLEQAGSGERPGALLMSAWTYLAHAYAGTQDVARLEALAERAARHPDATDHVRLQISTPLGDCLREAGDLTGAIAAHEAALEWALPGSPITAYTLGNLAFLHMLCGDWVRSEEAAVEGLLQLPSGEMTRARCFLTAVRLPALAASGRLADVERDLELIDRFTARGVTLVEVVTSLDRATAAPMPMALRTALTRSRDAAAQLLL
jgi:tetratricopeptide (TPR) repeat protein